MDQFGFMQAVNGFSQGIVVTVSPATHRGFDACFGQTPGMVDRDILGAPIAMMRQSIGLLGLARVECLLQGI